MSKSTGDPPAIHTIGHSTRPFDAFTQLLQSHAIDCVVDVRRQPGSRRYPQYDAQNLAPALGALGIDYWHATALGGRRGRSLPADEPSPNSFWQNASFRRYADYALGEAFQAGLRELLERSARQHCALMCAEAVWWRCHRRIITDYLLAAGRTVCHILGPGPDQAARLTPAAQPRGNTLVYPALSRAVASEQAPAGAERT